MREVRAEEPRGWERLELRDGVEDPEGQLQERHEIAGEIIDFSFDFLFVCVEIFFAWVVQFAF